MAQAIKNKVSNLATNAQTTTFPYVDIQKTKSQQSGISPPFTMNYEN